LFFKHDLSIVADVNSGSSLNLSGMASGFLRQEQDTGNNESRQNAGGSIAAEGKAAMFNRFVRKCCNFAGSP
jgi:hypothetical protein